MYASARARVYALLELGDSRTGRSLNALIGILIVLNVTAVVLESVEAIDAQFGHLFQVFEIVSVIVFSIEYVGRAWASAENGRFGPGWRGRLRYMLTPMAIIDLVAIVPFYLGFLIDADTRVLRALRLLRVFKLTRHSTAMDMLLAVIRNEAATVASSMFVMLIIIVLAASGIYLIEREAQPDAFESIPQAMWWAAVTLTTVGYGDVVPITVVGKVFGLLITIAGVGMVALPAGILASGFSAELQKRRAEYQLKIKQSMADGEVTRDELDDLREQAQNLGLSAEEADVMLQTETSAAPAVCKHCGKPPF
jgi:voltage-gated potassium channel